jgi:uncharacterized membrane protein required for colicin V production
MLDSAITLLVGIYMVKGFFAGDTREMRGLITIACCFAIAQIPDDDIATDLQSAGLTPHFSTITALALTMVTIYPGVYLMVALLAQELNYFGNKIPFLKRCLGASLGGLKAVTVCLLMSNVLLRLPLETQAIENSKFVQAMDCFPHNASTDTRSQELERQR